MQGKRRKIGEQQKTSFLPNSNNKTTSVAGQETSTTTSLPHSYGWLVE